MVHTQPHLTKCNTTFDTLGSKSSNNPTKLKNDGKLRLSQSLKLEKLASKLYSDATTLAATL